MKVYEVSAPMGLTLSAGRVKLTRDQVRRRAAQVKAVPGSDGLYDIVSQTAFKRGERFGYDGQPNKLLMTMLVDTEKAPAPAAPKATAKEKGK